MAEIPEEVRDRLESLPHVVGTCIGTKRVSGRETGARSLVVLVDRKVPTAQLAPDDRVPETVEVDGETLPTDVQEVGDVTAQSAVDVAAREPDRDRRWRPAPAGVSVGHPDITAGTLGSPPLSTANGETVLLTNAHVAAPDGAAAGDPLLQPGPADGGEDDDAIGELAEWSGIDPDGTNESDSALVSVDPADVRDDVLGIGPLAGFDEADLDADRTYVKSGRTTGVTRGGLRGRDARIRVSGFADEPVVFEGVDVFGPMSARGDSGSLIGYVDGDAFRATSLLFAGSDRVTLGIPLPAVRDEHGDLAPVAADAPDRFRDQVRARLEARHGADRVSEDGDGADFRVDAWPVELAVFAADDGFADAIERASASAGALSVPVVVVPEDVDLPATAIPAGVSVVPVSRDR